MTTTAPPPALPPASRTYARSPSPTAPPLIRGPSPLGGKVLVFQDDGRILVSEPVRPASAPALQPVGPRPPSPGSASLPLNPPDQNARQTSKRELQKIDCHELQKLIHSCLTDFTSLCRALLRIQSRISRHWSIPRRAARLRMKALLVELTTNAGYLARYLMAVSYAARKILNFVATCIKHTHGLSHFSSLETLTPVTDELRRLHAQFAALERAQERFGEEVRLAGETLEEGMDPDGWAPSSPPSAPLLSLTHSHTSLLRSLSSLSLFFAHLSAPPTLSAWHPPLLSPEDVKIVAGRWREVERRARDAANAVREGGGGAGAGAGAGVGVRELWTQAAEMGFVGRAEADDALRKFQVTSSSFSSTSSSSSPSPPYPPAGSPRMMPLAQSPARAGASIVRPSTTAGTGSGGRSRAW